MLNTSSPIQYLAKERMEKALLVRLMSDLIKIHGEFLSKYDEIKKLVSAPLKKGDKGDKPSKAEVLDHVKSIMGGFDIPSIVKNYLPLLKDGETPSDEKLLSLIKPLIPRKSKKIVITDEHLDTIAQKLQSKLGKPKAVENNEIDIEKLLMLISSQPKGKRLSIDFIDGLEQTIQSLSSQITSKGFVRGGGDVVKAGSNITITVDSNGNKVISTGVASTWYSDEVLTRTDGTNYTLAHTPTLVAFIHLNGQKLTGEVDYTRTGANIVMTNPTLASDILTATYA